MATAGPNHWVLIRRNPDDPTQLAYFYCYAPHGAPPWPPWCAWPVKRWPVETCIQHAKGLGIDGHQVRKCDSWHRHTALVLAVAALLAIASAKPAPVPR